MISNRRRVITALGSTMLAPLVAAPAWAQSSSRADRAFEALGRRWLDRSLRLSPISATTTGDHRFDHLIDDVSAAGRAAGLRFVRETLRALEAIDATQLSRANQVDALILGNALRAQIWQTETWQNWAWNPLGYQSLAGGALYGLMAREFAPLPQRLESATARMERLPALLAHARSELQPARVPAPHAETYAAQNRGLKSIVTDMIEPHKGVLNARKRARLEAAIATFNAAVDEHQAWIEGTLVPAAQADFRAGAEVFDTQLRFTLQSDLTRAEIRRRADAAVISVREEMYRVAKLALAGRADAPATPDAPTPEQQQAAIRAALDLAAADRPARDRLVETATEATEEARRFVIERDLITLPEGPVRVILMPEFQRGFAVAYCDSPGPLERHLDTFYAVSPIPDDWTDEQTTSFLREYNNRATLDIAVHEAMPGHYVQIYHSNRYPSTLRAVLGSGSFVEGWAVYAEEMMVQEGFRRDDPLFRLSQLKIQLRTITNAIIDQAIHVDGMSREEMMHLLTHTAFQEEREAAGKWRRAQLSVTQLSTYFVGFQEHLESRVAARAAWGEQFNLKRYHDGVLAFGSPPGRFARQLLLDEPIQ
ncbi:MAG TPA: DUF885 domain-containing protein [Verrucomicrobiae bacterium]|nr:DUF885 domain-containing protein [Verrucomicrobiae bacterium]